MRRMLQTLLILVLLLGMVPIVQAQTASHEVTTNPDDELVVITNDGRLVVKDLDVPAGFQPVVWESPVTGFTNVTAADFNGDGSAEVLGLRGSEAIVYDPVRRTNEPNTAFTFTASTGQSWQRVVTGDFDGNGSQEVVLFETVAPPNQTNMRVFYYSAANGWTQTRTQVHGINWTALATGKIMGNNRDQLVGVRPIGNNKFQILMWDPGDGWREFFDNRDYVFPWVNLAVGNIANDADNKDELVLTRSGVLDQRDSFLVMRWVAGQVNLQDVAAGRFFPEFRWIGLADVNASGDQEVFLLRPGRFNNTNIVGMTSRNIGNDTAVSFDDLSGIDKYKGIRGADFNGDNRDEVVVMSSNEYLIYTDPANGSAKTSTSGSFIDNGNFAVGNIDGPGIPTGPALAVSPLTLDFSVQAGLSDSKTINITNSSVGTLAWTATVTEGGSWLSLSAYNGTAPSTPQVIVTTSAGMSGSYVGKVRIDGAADVSNSPQIVTINLNVTAPQFAVSPTRVSWFYIPPNDPGTRSVTITGAQIPWTASVVNTQVAEQVEAALAAKQPVTREGDTLVIGAGENATRVPLVTWLTVNPTSGTAVPGGTFIDLSLILNQVPVGFSSANVIFIAQTPATPSALIVRAGVLRSADASDLYFLPMMIRN